MRSPEGKFTSRVWARVLLLYLLGSGTFWKLGTTLARAPLSIPLYGLNQVSLRSAQRLGRVEGPVNKRASYKVGCTKAGVLFFSRSFLVLRSPLVFFRVHIRSRDRWNPSNISGFLCSERGADTARQGHGMRRYSRTYMHLLSKKHVSR